MEQCMDYDLIIIGGGASGLMLASGLELNESGTTAAQLCLAPDVQADQVSTIGLATDVQADRAGNARKIRGVILEKTSALGTKLLMSGGGRCNITHGGSIKEFINAYGDSGTMLRKCLYRHSNIELANWLEDHGIALANEKGDPVSAADISTAGRIFPASMKASDVLGVLLDSAKANGWEIRTEADVYALEKDDQIIESEIIPDTRMQAYAENSGTRWSVKTGTAGTFRAPVVVIATGGITYPETGSDGRMLEIARNLGVEITEPRSALAPVYVNDYPYEEISGISISDVTVTVFSQDAAKTCKGKAAKMTGDLLFTHTGFSGPVMLNISRYAEPGEIIRISYNKNMNDLPRRMQHILEKRAKGPSGDVRTTVLAGLLDHDDFVVSAVGENGMITAGGISLSSIDMQTMQLSIGGLFAIGEAIDADGITGGYNLQMCWSTARTAADAIRTIV